MGTYKVCTEKHPEMEKNMITIQQLVAVKDTLGSYESDAAFARSVTGNYHNYVILEGRVLGYQEARNDLALLIHKGITDDNIHLLFKEWDEVIEHYGRMSQNARHQLKKDLYRGKVEAMRSAVAEMKEVVGKEWFIATVERKTTC